MSEMDPIVLLAVFIEMLGLPLLLLLVAVCVGGTLAFAGLLLRDRGIVARRMLWSQAVGVLGGVLALVLMARVSSSGFTDAGGPADWLLIGLIFGMGLVGTTIIVYSILGWAGCLNQGSEAGRQPIR